MTLTCSIKINAFEHSMSLTDMFSQKWFQFSPQDMASSKEIWIYTQRN